MKHILHVSKKLGTMAIVCLLGVTLFAPGIARACDVAVISGDYTSNGRPLIWKNRDCSASFKQQIKYFPAEDGYNAGGYLMVYNHDDVAKSNNGTPTNPSGGLNEAGFAIACTSVYEDTAPAHEAVNINTYLIWRALAQCATISDFEKLIQDWHDLYPKKVLSGNFVVIDAHGGAAMYECFTGSKIGYVQYRKSDANTGEVKRWEYPYDSGFQEGNGVFDTYSSIFDANFKDELRDDKLREKVFKANLATYGKGFWNLTNNNCYVYINYGDERQWRGEDILTYMIADATDPDTNVSYNGITYFSLMRYLAKDVVSGSTVSEYISDPLAYTSTYNISRNATRLGLVVDGVAKGDDPRLATFWCALGEPAVAVFVPYFAWGGRVTKFEGDCGVSYLAWADALGLNNDGSHTYYDLDDNSMLVRVSNRWEINRDNLSYELTDDGYYTYAYTCMYKSNTGSVISGMDNRMVNKVALSELQKWTLPLENNIVAQTETFLNILRNNTSLITNENLRNFSDYCAEYVYKNFSEGSATAYAWNYTMPSSGSTTSSLAEWILSILAL